MKYSYDKLEGLSVGDQFKNYAALCSFLEIKISGGDQKARVLANLARYCNYETIGREIVIQEVFDTPKPKPSRKGTVWQDSIGLSILYKLAETESLDSATVSIYMEAYELTTSVGLCNDSFYYGRKEYREQKDLGEKNPVQEEFFFICAGKFSSVMKTVKEGLESRYGIACRDVWRVRVKGAIAIWKEATPEQEKEIVQIHTEVLESINKEKDTNYKANTILLSRYKTLFLKTIKARLLDELGYVEAFKFVKFTFSNEIYKIIEALEQELELNEESSKLKTNKLIIAFVEDKMKKVMRWWVYLPSFNRRAEETKEAKALHIEEYKALIDDCLTYYNEPNSTPLKAHIAL